MCRGMAVDADCSPFVDKESRFSVCGSVGKLEVATIAPAESGELVQSGYVAIICHPHPLHGGTMDNKVVTTLARVYRDLGVPVARFNFRGVGASEGEFDDAVGEVDDLLAIVDWVKRCYPSRRLLLAGFSFGSSVAAQAVYRLPGQVEHLVLVAPPVERYSYDQARRFPCPLVVIMGDQDELVDVAEVYRWVDELESKVTLIRYGDASHFFHGKLVSFKSDLSSALLDSLSE